MRLTTAGYKKLFILGDVLVVSSKEYGQVAERKEYLQRLIIKWRKSGATPTTCFPTSSFVFPFRDPYSYRSLGKSDFFKSTSLSPANWINGNGSVP